MSVLCNVLARTTGWFAEWYAVTIYPYIIAVFGRIGSLLPFSVMEFGAYFLLILLLFLGIRNVKKIKAHEKTVLELLIRMGKTVFVFGIVIFIINTFHSAINYHRNPFSAVAGFEEKKSTAKALVKLCEFLTEEINREAELIQLEDNGLCSLPDNFLDHAGDLMQDLGETYECLSGYYPKAKPIWQSQLFSYNNLEGAYCSITVEANFNNQIPAYKIPAVVCHELSHLKGFMREDEANFIAYLACINSEVPEFRYSGNMQAYVYAINALYKNDKQAFKEIRAKLCETANADLEYYNAYWNQYQTVISRTSDKINDAYLKSHAQKDGIQSYGKVVDLMINYWNFA